MKYFGMQTRVPSDLFLDTSFSIKKQFHRLSKWCHPDKACNFGLSGKATESAFKLVNASMQFLKAYKQNPQSMDARELHDAWCTFKCAERETQSNFPEALQKLKEQ